MTGAAAGGGGPGSTRRAAVGKAGGRSRSAQPRAAAGGGSGGSGGGSEEEEQRDGGSLFLVNKSGFPMDGQTWERMWGHVERVHPDGGAVAAAIRSAVRLARVRRSPRFPEAPLKREGPSPKPDVLRLPSFVGVGDTRAGQEGVAPQPLGMLSAPARCEGQQEESWSSKTHETGYGSVCRGMLRSWNWCLGKRGNNVCGFFFFFFP